MPCFRRGRMQRYVTRRTRRWALHRGRRAGKLRQDFVGSDASGLGHRVVCVREPDPRTEKSDAEKDQTLGPDPRTENRV